MHKDSLRAFFALWEDESPTIEVRTSGSTGAPKAMQVEKSRMRASAKMTLDFLGIPPGANALLCLPMQYIAGMMMAVRSRVGKLNLISTEPDGNPLKHIDRPIDFAAMIPLQVFNSLQTEVEALRLLSINHLIIGGAALDKALEASLTDFPHCVWSTYGMTETLSHIALRKINGADRSPHYTPLPGVTISQTADGRLTIYAPHLHPETLTTNDLAEITPYGTFRILGRADNVINSGGVKLQIENIEQALRPHLSHPFAITSVPSEKFGEEVALLHTEAHLPENEIIRICHQSLQPYAVPRHIIKVNQIPTTANGKIARGKAKEVAAMHR